MNLKFLASLLFLSLFASAKTTDELRLDLVTSLQQQASQIALTASNNVNASEPSANHLS